MFWSISYTFFLFFLHVINNKKIKMTSPKDNIGHSYLYSKKKLTLATDFNYGTYQLK